MTSQDRQTLQNHFREGALPTAGHFVDLIDSMLNMTDEGFRKSPEHGLEISVPSGHDALISFFRAETPRAPLWGLRFSDNQLSFRAPAAIRSDSASSSVATLCLDQQNRVGIAKDDPEAELDVGGTIRCQSRRGSYAIARPEELLADGKWHPLLGELVGCHAFEILVGAGAPGTGHFALTHAIAVNAYNPTLGLLNFVNWRRKVRCTSAYYSHRWDRIRFRWVGASGRNAKYGLEVRSGTRFGDNCRLIAHVTRLWFDPHMTGASAP